MSIYFLSSADRYVEIHNVTPVHVEYYSFSGDRTKTRWSSAINCSNVTKEHLQDLCKAYKANDKETLTYYSLIYSKG